MGNHSEASAIGIRMATGPLKVYSMHEGPSASIYETEGEQESTCSLEESINQSCSSVDHDDDDFHAAPINSFLLHQDDEPLAMDIVRTMCRQEATIYHHPVSYYVQHVKHHQKHVGASSSSRRKKKKVETMDSWRSSLIQWMYQVADFSQVRPETVGVAVYFLDVAISKIIVRAMNRNNSTHQQSSNCQTQTHYSLEDYKVSFQLAAATALQLAIKTQDCQLIKLKDLVILGRNAFTERDITRMEVQIIEACSWYLHPPSVYCYLHQYQSLMYDILSLEDSKAIVSKLVHRITELILPQAEFKTFPPSILAYAIMLVAMAFVNVSPQQRQCLSRQISLALIVPNEDNKSKHHSSKKEEQHFLLLQAIQQIQVACQSCSHFHLDGAAILQDLIIVESMDLNGDDSNCLVCMTMDDYSRYHGPKTPPTSTSQYSSMVTPVNRNHSPTSVLEGSSLSQILLPQHPQQNVEQQ